MCPGCHSPYWDRKRKAKTAYPLQSILDEVVGRIVKACDPDKIILFGSHATGRAGPDSDLDLLVIANVEGSRRKKATEIDAKLYGIPVPVDLIVVTLEQMKKEGRVPGSILHTAVSEGQTLYERAA